MAITTHFTTAAQENIDATGTDPLDDIERLRSGAINEAQLLEEVLDGADDETHAGWHEYVRECVAAAAR